MSRDTTQSRPGVACGAPRRRVLGARVHCADSLILAHTSAERMRLERNNSERNLLVLLGEGGGCSSATNSPRSSVVSASSAPLSFDPDSALAPATQKAHPPRAGRPSLVRGHPRGPELGVEGADGHCARRHGRPRAKEDVPRSARADQRRADAQQGQDRRVRAQTSFDHTFDLHRALKSVRVVAAASA